ncbi:hypothetical protein ACLKA6_008484 [Drosophila palustris]
MSSGDKPRRKSISDSTRKPTPGPTVKPSPSSLRLQPSTKAPTPNIKKSLSPSTKSESLKIPTPKITRSITQSQQGRSKMALDDFIAASDRLSHFEAILAGSSQTVPSLSSLRIRRDQVQNIWAIIEQEYGRCSKALREDPSNANDLTAIQANTPGSPAGARTNAGNAAKTITRSSTCVSKAARPRGSLAAPLSQAPRSDTAVRRHGKAVPGTGAVHHHGVGHRPLHEQATGPPPTLASLLQHKSTNVLPTAVVRLQAGDSSFVLLALYDPCAAVSSISASLAAQLKLPALHVGDDRVCKATVASKVDADLRFDVLLKIVKGLQICTPVRPLGDSVRARFANLTLANDNFHRPSTISLVLGADAANHVVTEGFMPSQNGLPMAQSTIFGWMVSGSCSC